MTPAAALRAFLSAVDAPRRYLAAPVNNANLAVWRILFGALMLAESWGAILTGWVRANLVEPDFTFGFIGFEWVQAALVGPQAYAYFFAMGLAALGVCLGWRYRFCASALAVLWTGAYLAQKTSYNNHYYLAVLLCWWMALVPAHRRAALDVARTGVRAFTHARWIAVLAKAQLLIVFVYGAAAKLYPGWLRGEFIATTFARKTHYPVIGPLLGSEAFQTFIVYGAIAFDALVIPLLWYRPTRRLAFWGLVAFNLFNSVVFQIGIFPYLVLAMTVFFAEPEWVERRFRLPPKPATTPPAATPTTPARLGAPLTAALLAYLALQLALPLRHYAIAGDVNWREEGHRMSWRMMLRAKGGSVRLEARNPDTGERELVRPRDFLTAKQASRLATKPYFLHRFARRLEDHYRRERGWRETEVYALRSRVSLNGTPARPLVDPATDLTAVDWNYWGRNDWVLDRAP